MNVHPTSTEMSRGRETAPFPGTQSPKTNLGRLHKTLDTPNHHDGKKRTLPGQISYLAIHDNLNVRPAPHSL